MQKFECPGCWHRAAEIPEEKIESGRQAREQAWQGGDQGEQAWQGGDQGEQAYQAEERNLTQVNAADSLVLSLPAVLPESELTKMDKKGIFVLSATAGYGTY